MSTHPPLHHTGLCASAATDTRQYVHYSDVEGVVREIKIVDDKVVNLGKDKFSGAKYFSPLATFHWLSGSGLVCALPRNLGAPIPLLFFAELNLIRLKPFSIWIPTTASMSAGISAGLSTTTILN